MEKSNIIVRLLSICSAVLVYYIAANFIESDSKLGNIVLLVPAFIGGLFAGIVIREMAKSNKLYAMLVPIALFAINYFIYHETGFPNSKVSMSTFNSVVAAKNFEPDYLSDEGVKRIEKDISNSWVNNLNESMIELYGKGFGDDVVVTSESDLDEFYTPPLVIVKVRIKGQARIMSTFQVKGNKVYRFDCVRASDHPVDRIGGVCWHGMYKFLDL